MRDGERFRTHVDNGSLVQIQPPHFGAESTLLIPAQCWNWQFLKMGLFCVPFSRQSPKTPTPTQIMGVWMDLGGVRL